MYDVNSSAKTSRFKPGFDKLVKAFNENPLMVIAVGAAVMTAGAKIIDAVSSAQGRRAYAKQVNFRVGPR